MDKTILLVEDEALIALNEAKLLERHGYAVQTVYTGEEAVELAATEPEIELVLMDIDLGEGMDGTEAAAQILEMRELPVVFLTSHAEKEMVERVKHITRYGYVLKSSGEFVLLESLNMAFELFEAHMRSKEKERELEEANALKRLILDSTSELFAFYDRHLTIRWANRAAAESVGLSPQELIGRHCYEVWQQRSVPCEACPLRRVLETGKPEEEEMGTPDGREWLLRGYPVHEKGEITGLVEFGRDITSRREAERGMLTSEERYRILYNNISDAIILVNNDREITHCNPAFTELFGYTLDEVRGHTTSLLFADPAEYEELGKAMRDHTGQRSFRYTVRYMAKSGRESKGEKNVHYLRDAGGELSGFIGVIREVSEQKYSEAQLRASERNYAELFEYAPVIMWEEDFSAVREHLDTLRERGIDDLETYFAGHPEEFSRCIGLIRIINVNRETMKLLGISRKEDVLGSLEKIYTEPSFELLKNELLAVWEGRTILEDTGTVRPPGGEDTEIILRWQVLPNSQHSLAQVVISFVDITRRVRAEQQLAESERRYRELYDSIRDAIVLVDERRIIRDCNHAFSELFGYRREAIEGKNTSLLFADEEEYERLGELMHERTDEANFFFTARYRSKSGEVFIGEKNVHYLYDGGGRFAGYLGVIRDVTERIQWQEKVQQLLSEKQMLLREVHHRIKNDMSSISSLLSLQSSSLTNPEAVNALREAQNRIALMGNIYDTLYKAEGFHTIPVSDFLQSIIDNIRKSQRNYSGISIETDFEEIVIPAKQAFPIGIIINELITNAYKYAFPEAGRGIIRAALFKSDQDHLTIRVADNGAGFPEEVRQQGNYGFGLTLVDAFSRQYEGEMRVESGEMNEVRVSLQISE